MTARRIPSLLARCLVVLATSTGLSHPQDLAPRAYVISPTGSHAIILSASFNKGDVLVDPTVPADGAKGTFQLPLIGYYQSLSVLGRSANVTVLLPYVRGDFEGSIDGTFFQAYRSGMADARVRFSINLHGGPAMKVGEYLRWTEKRLIGASVTVTMPTGQYDPARLVNTGTNRWGFKPEVGLSRRWGRWAVDWYTGMWVFTANNRYFPGGRRRTQQPIGAVEGHVGYYLRPRLWASFDANFWMGDRSTIDGVVKRDQQRNSRIGGTVSIPINRHHSIKCSYSQGAYVTVGGAFKTFSTAWQYSWIKVPR